MTLDELRAAIRTLDQELLALVARRLQLASEVGAQKRRLGLLTRDPRQERDVIEHARSSAAALGVPAPLAEQLMLAMIHSSLAVQEREGVAATGGGGGRRVLIIGGAGRMGRWFAGFLAAQEWVVEISDPAGPLAGMRFVADPFAAPLDHDLVIVAAQLRPSADILLRLAQQPPSGVVFDIGSLKTPLREGLHALRAAGASVTSVHPMFGPSAELLSGRHVLFVHLGDDAATRTARELFAPTMAIQTELELEVHDRLMAYVLGLSHATNLAFFTALARSGAGAPELVRLSSTTFDAQLAIARAVADENPHLYFEIQSLNAHTPAALAGLREALAAVTRTVTERDEAGFAELMQSGRAYLAQRER